MNKSWNVIINGITHKVEYKVGFETKIMIDGEVHTVKSQNWLVCLVDYPIIIDGIELRVVIIGNKARLAVNGIYEGSDERYVPLNKVPAISDVFIIISCIAGFLLNGVLGLLIGILFSQFYVKKGIAGKTRTIVGAFIGFIITMFVIAFILFFYAYS